MPEVTVTKHGNLDSGKDEVGTPGQIHRMQAIAKAERMKYSSQCHFGAIVA